MKLHLLKVLLKYFGVYVFVCVDACVRACVYLLVLFTILTEANERYESVIKNIKSIGDTANEQLKGGTRKLSNRLERTVLKEQQKSTMMRIQVLLFKRNIDN